MTYQIADVETSTSKEKTVRFVSLEVKGVKEIDSENCMVVDDADADFFSIYGRDHLGCAYCIGDFSSKAGAEFIKTAIESGR